MACWHVLCGAGQNAISSICFLMGLSTALVTSIASKSLKSLRDGLNLTDRIHVHQEHEENSEIHQKLGVWIGVLLSCVASESSSRRQESRAPPLAFLAGEPRRFPALPGTRTELYTFRVPAPKWPGQFPSLDFINRKSALLSVFIYPNLRRY